MLTEPLGDRKRPFDDGRRRRGRGICAWTWKPIAVTAGELGQLTGHPDRRVWCMPSFHEWWSATAKKVA